MNKSDKIFVTGHRGMVGSAIVRALQAKGFKHIITATRQELDLRLQAKVGRFFKDQRPDYVFLSAAKVGGINANMSYPAEFLYDNLMIQTNVIHESWKNGVKKLCFLGSSCVYPRECPQPMKEEYLLTGPLEPTNEGYAVAKITGLKMAKLYYTQYGFRSICHMPCNLYGTNDSFDLRHAHVLSALVRRFVDAVDEKAEKVTIWGTGRARREFMHVDDAAAAFIFLMEKYDSPEIINIGWGEDISIKELAGMIALKSGFRGALVWDASKPDGMPRKCLDVSRMKELGFHPGITLEEGIERTMAEYRALKLKGAIA